ncbi:putative lipid II flippase FtsW [Candidatus Poribacteria bacterium]|nr:putative lipid II flippase FtsW [Candidatus Poribacteria bacterium]
MLKDNSNPYPEHLLLIMTIILTFIGIVMIYSSGALRAEVLYDTSYMFLLKQSIGLVIGFIAMWFVSRVDIHAIKRYSLALLVITIALLVLVLVVGRRINGAKRWLNLYFFTLQPSELARLTVTIYLADVISRKQKILNDFMHGLLPIIIILGVVLLLIQREPDLGRLVIISAISFIVLWAGGLKLRYIIPLVLIAVLLIGVWIIHDPVRSKRFLSSFEKKDQNEKIASNDSNAKNTNETNYQLKQSLKALQFGGLMGVGLGNSRQKFFYLPEAHNDFIFAIIGEELGIIGTGIVAILFFIFIWCGFTIASKSYDLFQELLAAGIVSMLGMEAIINMGVVIGLLPTKGTPLPFVSYGVSSLIVNLIAVGLLLNIARNSAS